MIMLKVGKEVESMAHQHQSTKAALKAEQATAVT
jgi:hypothetical protein